MKKLVHEIVTVLLISSLVGNVYATNGSSNTPQKKTLDQAIQKSLNTLESYTIADKSSGYYGGVKDPNSGLTFLIKKSAKDDLDKFSPKNFSHFAAFKNATHAAFGPYGSHFAVEAASFYMGVGANHVINLLTKYQKNPMALEMFIEELKDPVAQAGFFAFMVGNRYAQAIFQDLLMKSKNPYAKKYLAPFLGFLAMGVGSVFSNITHDLITLTKPCAEALYNPYKPEYDTAEKRAAKCQEGWDAVMTSDNLARYVTSVMTVVLAAFSSAVAQQLLKAGGALSKKTVPIQSIVMLFDKAKKTIIKRPVSTATKIAPPSKFGLRTVGNLVLFLQADELFHPHIHHLVESVGNSSPKLAATKRNANLLLNKLEANKWEDVVGPTCKNTIQHISKNKRDHTPSWIQNDMKVCSDGMASMLRFHEKNKKWRETLSYDFMNSYMNWMRFISEFIVMHDVSMEFFAQMITYSHNKDEDIRTSSYSYNPLAFDNPFYGVNLSEKVDVADEADFRAANKSKAQRVVESITLIDKAIIEISRTQQNWNKNGVQVKSDFLKDLREIKSLILFYKNEPLTSNYSHLVTAIGKIISLSDEILNEKMSFAPRSGSQVGPYASTATKEHVNQFAYDQNEHALRKKHIRLIKNYLGNPKPLEKTEAFFEVFNDFVKSEKSEYMELFDEKGSPAETLTWYAICGNPLKGENARVDRRRNSLAAALDSGVSKLFSGINSITGWVAEKTNSENKLALKTDLSPALNTFKAIKFGTGVDFYVPRIVRHELKDACNPNYNYPIKPSTSKNAISAGRPKIKVDGKTYDSLFSYLINNIKPEVLNIAVDDSGYASTNFLAWWDKTITPKVELAHNDFLMDYTKLLRNSYRTAIDGDVARNNSQMIGLKDIVLSDRTKPWNTPSNMIQSYAEELVSYLKILDRIYTTTPTYTNKTSRDVQLFRSKVANFRNRVYGMLNDFRNFKTNGEYIPQVITLPNGVPKIVDSPETHANLFTKYAKVLFELRAIYGALGFGNEVIGAAAVNTPFYKDKEGAETIPPMARLVLRVQNDPAIGEPFSYIQDDEGSHPVAISYGLTDKNINIETSGTGLNQQISNIELVNFKNNDRLALAFLTANNLYDLVEELYTNISILNAANVDASYKPVELPQNAPRGSGSRPF
jgi:hypothetical protein